MITLTTFGLMRCCPNQGCGWDPAAKIVDSRLPWVDLAVGVILNLVGSLALYGAYTLPGYQWFIVAGSLQIVLTLFMKWRKCCMACKNMCSSYNDPWTKEQAGILFESLRKNSDSSSDSDHDSTYDLSASEN